MRQILFIVTTILLFPFFVLSQTVITGSVKNKKSEPLAANVMVQAKGSTRIEGFAVTDENGDYTLTYKGTVDSVTITVTGMNIGKYSRVVVNRVQKLDFVIEEKPLKIEEINVLANKLELRGDTLNYLVPAYIDQNDRVIGDILKKLPGIEVAPSGRISYQGKSINKFYVENMDLLQGRYGIATNNIPAKDVAAVQVLENHQPVKALRDKIFSDEAAINLKLKDSAKGSVALTGLAGIGYQPLMWNAELVGMYFAKIMQNMSIYKSNNSGDDVVSETRAHYDSERISMNSGSILSVQSPATPSVPQKRYLQNQSHSVTSNQLFKLNEDTELTTNILYYNDRIKRESYSLNEQYLPGDSTLSIEEQVSTINKIHNAEIALRFNSNAKDHYLSNALNLNGSWNNDLGLGTTRSKNTNLDETIRQHLNRPTFSVDNTLNLIKNIQNNTYKIYFSTGYGHRSHFLTVSPASYFGNDQLASLTQHVLSKDLASILRLSYGLKLRNFMLNYDLWGRADIRNMKTDLLNEMYNGSSIALDDSLKNDLGYNTFQVGINQGYSYDNGAFKARLQLPLVYYVLSIDNRIPGQSGKYNKWLLNPSFSVKYDLTPELAFSVGGGLNRSYGDMNSTYTGYIMHNYRSLLRNSIDRLFESHSGNGYFSATYRNVLRALFINAGINYNRSWKNLLYGYNYQGIMSVKTTIDQPTQSDGYGVRINMSKGLNFCSATVRAFGAYNVGKGELLIQDEIMNYRSNGYNAGGSMNMNPVSFLGFSYSLTWNQSKNYIEESSERFPFVRGISQSGQISVFPHKSLTINFNIEHQYNSAASNRNTSFADAGVKFKSGQWDLELALNNLFNARQYVSASYNDINSYYCSYNLRPVSVLLKIRFKII